jgi:hypothetical protein
MYAYRQSANGSQGEKLEMNGISGALTPCRHQRALMEAKMKKLALLVVLALFGACGDEAVDSPKDGISKQTYALTQCTYAGQRAGSIWIQSYLPQYLPTRFFVKWSCNGASYDPTWSYATGPSVWDLICVNGRDQYYFLKPVDTPSKCLGFYNNQYPNTHTAYVIPTSTRKCLSFRIEYGQNAYKFRAMNPDPQMSGPYLTTTIYGGSAYWHCNCLNCNNYTAHYMGYSASGSEFEISEL